MSSLEREVTDTAEKTIRAQRRRHRLRAAANHEPGNKSNLEGKSRRQRHRGDGAKVRPGDASGRRRHRIVAVPHSGFEAGERQGMDENAVGLLEPRSRASTRFCSVTRTAFFPSEAV